MTKTSLKDRLKKQKKDVLFNVSNDLPKVIEVKLLNLSPNPDQPRQEFEPERLKELANSIDKHGLLQPITVKPDAENHGEFFIVAGERRFRAHQLLGKESIAAILTTGNADEIALIENLQREDLNPIEEAEALQRIMQRYNYTQEELAKVIGKSRVTVNELLSLNSLPEKLRQEARANKTNKSLLIELSRLNTETEQLNEWQKVKEGKSSVKSLRGRKKTNKTTKRSPLATKVITEGKGLIRRLEKAETDGVRFNDRQYSKLLEIYSELGKLIEKFATKD